MTQRVLLAWEGGAGRGHISTLRNIALALQGQATCDAAVNSTLHAGELAPFCDLVFHGSSLVIDKQRRTVGGLEPICSWADHLGDLGFADADFLIGRIGWWIQAIRARAANVVVADFAPVATLAARVLGLGSVVIGTGYLAPPPGLEQFPQLAPHLSLPHYHEDQLLDAVNAALAHFGAAPLLRFSDIYQCDVFLPQTIAALDPYAGQRAAAYLAPVDQGVPLAGQGDEIFGYFSTDEHRDEALLEALRRLGPLLRLHMPGLSNDQRSVLAGAGVMQQQGPAPLDVLAARTRLSLNAGQHGTLCMALALGLPQLAIPRHLEHAYHAQRGRDLGCVDIIQRRERDPAAIHGGIMAAYETSQRRQHARDVAHHHRDQLCGPLQETLRRRLAPLLCG